MTDQYFKELKSELQLAMTEKDHPLRYCTLATVGLDQVARLRTIVVRDISDDFVFTFYTDLRSKKIVHIKENNRVSLLFFHPKKMLQLKVEGVARIKKDPAILKPLWKTVEPMSKKNYTTVLSPGSTLDYPDRVEYLNNEDHFCLVEVHPHKIEYLKLSAPVHRRIRFSRKEEGWRGEFLVP